MRHTRVGKPNKTVWVKCNNCGCAVKAPKKFGTASCLRCYRKNGRDDALEVIVKNAKGRKDFEGN